MKLIAEVGSKKISSDDFLNNFFSLLVGYLLTDKITDTKLGQSDVEKFSKIIFDLTLESIISRNSIKELIEKEKNIKFTPPSSQENGEELKEMILAKLSIIGEESQSQFINPQTLQEIIESQIFITDFIKDYLQKEGILSYEKIEEYYKKTFHGFLFLSLLFVSLPKLLKESEKKEIISKMETEDPSKIEKMYERDTEKIIYYYENIDVFNYFTTDSDFDNQKMYRLYDILEGIGIDPDNMFIDKSIKNKIININSETRENYYKFTKIDYEKPEFNDKIYEYIREYVFDSLYDEVWEKLYSEATDKIKIKFYEENIIELEKLLRPISRKWFQNLEKLY